MTAACPPDSDLRRLFADSPLSPIAVESHLSDCPKCRQRLDELAGVSCVTPTICPAPTLISPALRSAISRLVAIDTSAVIPTARPTTPLPRLAPPTRPGFLGHLNGLDIKGILGRGGMGVVYEGHDPVLNRSVAVKVLAERLAFDADAKERFLREARAAAAVTHENVVAIHAIDQCEGVPFLVLQFVPGESLAELLTREGTLTADRAAEIGTAVAKGLAAAHAKGVIHRDIKPANVLIEAETGIVRLTDFGLAKVLGMPTVTAVDTVAGTPAFLSPEQALGNPLDPRSDLYSLGVLLYACVSGRLPFDAESPFVLLSKIARDAPPPLPDTVPGWFRAVVSRLLEKDPARRFQTAAEVADTLAPKAEPLRDSSARVRWPWVVVPLAVVVVAGVVFALTRYPGVDKTDDNPQPKAAVEQPKADPSKAEEPRPKPAVSGFSIDGKPDKFESLAEVVQAARSGDVIEVRGDGSFTTAHIDTEDKALTIRAAPGSRPRFVPDAGAKTRPWLTGSGDLILDGLTTNWQEGPVITARGKFTMTRCAIFASKGPCIDWTRTGTLSLTQVALEGDIGIATVAVLGSDRTVTLTNCTFRTETAVAISTASNTVTPLWVTTEKCVFDAPTVAVVVHPPKYIAGRVPTPAETRATGRKALTWTDRDSAYRSSAQYLAARVPGERLLFTELATLDAWQKYWGETAGTAIAGELKFADRPAGPKSGPPKLLSIDKPSGKAPADLGVKWE